MIELLMGVSILGIVAAVAIPGVVKVVNKRKTETYEAELVD